MEQYSLNFYGILVESLTIIFSWKKTFIQITIATIFPLSLLSLSHAYISDLFLSNTLPHNVKGSFKNPNMAFCLFKIIYVVLFLSLSLVSTSAVVHAVARIYTTREVCFGEAMSAVPRVWKRVMVTFAWSLMIVVVYNMATFSLLYYSRSGSMEGLMTGQIAVSGPVFVIYMIGFAYISMVWHVASVVSVLEEECGVEAMMKSKELVKGNLVISGGVFLVLNLCFILIQVVFQRFVVGGSRIVWGIGCLLLLSGFTLLGLVSQTIVYFICRLYHCEMIYISLSHFANHHKLHFGDYAPLGSNDVQRLDQC